MRVYNFAPGPATLPLEVLEQAAAELADWRGSGMSVMEVSHRSKAFLAVASQAEADLRELLSVPDDYRVLFLQGGATGQFAAVPLNLAGPDATVTYLNTGTWSTKAIAEARRFCRDVQVLADQKDSNYSTVPAEGSYTVPASAAYLHYTPNETIGGVEYPYIPESGAVPLVADLSSTILSRRLDVTRFGVIYAGAQKNIGPSGLTVVIVRADLLGHARAGTPSVMDWQAMAAQDSMLNTPPTFGWYLAGLVFQWLKRQGGLAAVEARNRAKAQALYSAIDGSGYYRNPVSPDCRSWMNVPFSIPDSTLESAFLEGARAAGLHNLEGHRSVGGFRASIYNAMPEAGVAALIHYMLDFARRRG